ncbi:MAG: dihydrodipicolinate synthase family protein [Pseudomonadota bacterium]
MIETRPLVGVIPVVQTPLTVDRDIDIQAIHRHIDFLEARKVGGYWALGTGSEDMNLTFAERLTAARALCEANNGRLPLILGAGFYCYKDSVAFMQETRALEFDAYHVMPYHPLLSMGQLDTYYRMLADAAPKPLWLYTSANWAQPLKPDFIEKLVEHPNIAGVKYSTQRTTDMLKTLTFVSPQFQMITAVAAQWAVTLAMGVKAGTTSLAGALPEMLLEIYDHHQAGRREEAMAAQHRMNAFTAAWPKVKADNFLTGAEEKYILSRRGIMQPFMTSYYRELSAEEITQMDNALNDFGWANLPN